MCIGVRCEDHLSLPPSPSIEMADGSAVPSSSAAVRPYSPCPRSLLPMNSAFWSHTPAHAGAHGHHHQPTAQQTCDAPCCNPQPSDWLSSMSCSIPDCSTAKSAPTPSCTDQCVVVTHHVDQKCDGNCDSGSFPPCDFSCDGFDNNWPCDSTDCTMSFPHVNVSCSSAAVAETCVLIRRTQPTPASYPHHSHGHSHHSHGHHAQDFGHSFHPSPHSYHSYYCPCSSGDFSHCNCSAAASVSPFFSHPSHHQYHQSPHHHQSHQAPPLPPKLPLSTYASTPVPIQTSVPHQFPTSHYPSPSPMFAHQQSSIFQPPHVQMPPPYQPNPQTQPEKSCMWGDCHASFSSTNDLLAHLTANHLPVAEAPAAQPVATLTTSCLWNDCHAHPDSSALLGPDADADAIANFLTTHLLQEHLGLVSPPIEKQHSILPPPPSVTSVTTTLPSIGLLSPVSALSPRAGSEPSDDGSSVLSPLTPSLAALESRSVALTEPETHGCMWEDCNNIFSTCDALTAHIASAHVGSGKAQYECIWRGCPRVGGQPFASKQKILRHIQVSRAIPNSGSEPIMLTPAPRATQVRPTAPHRVITVQFADAYPRSSSIPMFGLQATFLRGRHVTATHAAPYSRE